MRANEGRPGRLDSKIEEFLLPRPKPVLNGSTVAGIKAGFVAAALSLLFLSWTYTRQNGDALLPIKYLAFNIYGDHFYTLPLGLAMWFLGGMALGGIYGVIISTLVGRVGGVWACCVGGVYGVLIWIVMVFVIMGFFVPNMLMLYASSLVLWGCVIFGAVVGLLVPTGGRRND